MNLNKISEFFSIVILGNFNPLLFHPYWLKAKNLIAEEDINLSELLVHPTMSHLNIGKWMYIDVNNKKCEFRTDDPSMKAILIDLVIGCMAALPDIKISALGVNYGGIYDLMNEQDYYKFGKQLHGLDLWRGSFEDPRLRTIIIEDNKSNLLSKKSIIIRSADNTSHKYAVELNMNFHKDIPQDKQTTTYASEEISKNWQVCIKDYLNVFQNIEKIANHV